MTSEYRESAGVDDAFLHSDSDVRSKYEMLKRKSSDIMEQIVSLQQQKQVTDRELQSVRDAMSASCQHEWRLDPPMYQSRYTYECTRCGKLK